ncbi:MAG: preprotein translocase subunit YajC [Actinobacteria bacterium]|jgi:preprotein translocase subunit YajC|nr:preprotein translocase subunit YajC [Actinomycetota bacterium]MBT3745623.1 preprotein translocase subunit YajC [Actinomycetota bacterium]MBT3968816.1 preprotein translocase subunit YajC [Actinomycetota bacterium]MBT4010008.1 preprotein translocase subunit YajC [Actinomycetota bacterium]MBT4303183.1 preprotein translocase subunit YajC [Actinomycetota bacterium]
MEFLPLIAIFAIMYFLMIRPQQKKMRQQRSLVDSLKTGDEVVLNSGIFGVISEVDGDVVWLEVAGDLELKVLRGAVEGRFNDDTNDDDAEEEPEVDLEDDSPIES